MHAVLDEAVVKALLVHYPSSCDGRGAPNHPNVENVAHFVDLNVGAVVSDAQLVWSAPAQQTKLGFARGRERDRFQLAQHEMQFLAKVSTRLLAAPNALARLPQLRKFSIVMRPQHRDRLRP